MATTNTSTTSTQSTANQGAVGNVPLSNTAPITPMRYIGSGVPTPVLQLDKVTQSAHAVSIICKDNLFDGNVVELGALAKDQFYGDGEVFNVAQVSDSSDMVVLVSCGGVDSIEYIPSNRRYVEAGKITRAYILTVGDVITLTNSGIAGVTPTEGTYIKPNGYNLTVADSKPASGLVLKCIGTQMLDEHPASILMVVRA